MTINSTTLPGGWTQEHEIEALADFVKSSGAKEVLMVGVFIGRVAVGLAQCCDETVKIVCVDKASDPKVDFKADDFKTLVSKNKFSASVPIDAQLLTNIADYPNISVIHEWFGDTVLDIKPDMIVIDVGVKPIVKDLIAHAVEHNVTDQTILCGLHFNDAYAGSVVDSVNEYATANDLIVSMVPSSNIWVLNSK